MDSHSVDVRAFTAGTYRVPLVNTNTSASRGIVALNFTLKLAEMKCTVFDPSFKFVCSSMFRPLPC